MNRFGRLSQSSLVALCALSLAAPQAAASEAVKALPLSSGHSVVLDTPGLTRVGVGDPTIAGVLPLGNSQVVINAKSAGRTTVFIWMGARHLTYEVGVTEQSLDDLARMLRSSISEPGVRVSSFDKTILVKGNVRSSEDFLRLDDTIARFSKVAEASKYTIVNAVAISQPLGDLQTDLKAVSDATDVEVERDDKGDLIVSGRALDRSVAEKVLARVKAHAGTYLAADGKIIDRLAIDTTTQVDVKVYVLEVDQTAMSQLGLRLQSATPTTTSTTTGNNTTSTTTYTLGNPNFPALEAPSLLGKALTIGAFYRNIVLAPTLDLILNNGHARILSSPDLVTMPGQQATFLVGGQIPVPFASGPSQIAINYKDFGVSLKVTPTILGNGSVETLVAPEVSDLDFTDGVQISGFTIPALKTSRLATDVVTRSGESIVLGGMMRRMETKNITKIPLLGDIPILGQLFRSTNYQNASSDLVFVMTPQILVR